MSFTVAQVFTDVQEYLSGRTISTTQGYEWIRKSVLELSETYKFPTLQVTGPTVQLTIYSPGPYNYNLFMHPGDAGLEIECIDSFFIYYQQPVSLSGSNGENAGLLMKFKTIDSIELSTNITGQTIFWTRFQGQIYFAFAPIMPYYVYCRYRKENKFSSPVSGTDPILLPNTWQDIVGYAAAERGAISLDLNDRQVKYHNILYGDPKWQATGGTEGAPGLIFMRTSQEQRDKQNSGISMRLMMRSPQNV
jgi:hypothetical protein